MTTNPTPRAAAALTTLDNLTVRRNAQEAHVQELRMRVASQLLVGEADPALQRELAEATALLDSFSAALQHAQQAAGQAVKDDALEGVNKRRAATEALLAERGAVIEKLAALVRQIPALLEDLDNVHGRLRPLVGWLGAVETSQGWVTATAQEGVYKPNAGQELVDTMLGSWSRRWTNGARSIPGFDPAAQHAIDTAELLALFDARAERDFGVTA